MIVFWGKDGDTEFHLGPRLLSSGTIMIEDTTEPKWSECKKYVENKYGKQAGQVHGACFTHHFGFCYLGACGLSAGAFSYVDGYYRWSSKTFSVLPERREVREIVETA